MDIGLIYIIALAVILLLIIKPFAKVYLETKEDEDKQNLHPTYNKKVMRGKDGRFRRIN